MTTCEEPGCVLKAGHGGNLHAGPVSATGLREFWAMAHAVDLVKSVIGSDRFTGRLS